MRVAALMGGDVVRLLSEQPGSPRSPVAGAVVLSVPIARYTACGETAVVSPG